MAIINTSALDNSTNLLAMTDAINVASNYVLVSFLLATIFAILLIVVSRREGMKNSVLVASSISSLLATGFWALDMLNFQYLILCIMIMFGSVMIKVFTQD